MIAKTVLNAKTALTSLLTFTLVTTASTQAPARQPEAQSLFGEPLYAPELAPAQKAKLEADLTAAQAEYERQPNDAERIIWVGRRLGYLGRFREAIETYSTGIRLDPSNPKLYRHRGHRYISIREFDKAIADLGKASTLVKGQPDEIEPDGAPNRFGKPRSTLQSNIWYHLALAHYLKGEFARAIPAYLECTKVSKNDDMIVATADWLYMTYRRLGRTVDAARVLVPIHDKMEILENTAYHRRLLMYKGLLKPEEVLDPKEADPVQIATQGYGVGNWYFVNGDKDKARTIFEKVRAGSGWAAFGYIAAEADLKRAAAQGQPPRGSRPNIIYIMTDDHAAHAIGAYGSRVNTTPQIDRLAREGALLTNVFATNSICTPSRAAILTGQYSHVNGVTMFNRFDSSRMTVARLMQQGGYHTGMIGKWHLGSDPAGFDRWDILPGQGAYRDPIFYTATGEKTYTGRYATEVITDLALEFIENRPRDKPFFLMMHHKAPHRPWEPADRHAAHFATLRIPEPATFWDSYATRTDALHENQQRVAVDLTNRDLKLPPPPELAGPERAKWLTIKPDTVTIVRDGKNVTLTGEALVRWKYQRYMQDYLATVQSVDDSVGRVLALLDKVGLAKTTMVIYTSDQGFFLGDHGLYDKRFMYEESIRMPFLVRWPERIKAGSRSDALALNIDFAPTFLEAARLPLSIDMQGRSLLPVLTGRTPADWRSSMYYRYYHDPGDHNTRAHYGVRTRTHKLIHFWKKNQWELFDLVNDPDELHNLYGEPGQDALTAMLTAELTRLKREVRDDDQLADQQLPNGVDGPVAKLRGR